MKLIIILMCLASERYLVHAAAEYRKKWFDTYYVAMLQYLTQNDFLKKSMTNAYFVAALIILPMVCLVGLILWLSAGLLFGLLYFILNLVVFYGCIGSDNLFYPVSDASGSFKEVTEKVSLDLDEDINRHGTVSHYFVTVNNQMFAPIYVFMLTGALGVLAYRLVSLCTKKIPTQLAAVRILSYIDWVTARLTVLLYLLVGNFQRGFQYYTQNFFAGLEENNKLLEESGLLAAEIKNEVVSLPYAQILVEHALVVWLVLLAFFTLVAWA